MGHEDILLTAMIAFNSLRRSAGFQIQSTESGRSDMTKYREAHWLINHWFASLHTNDPLHLGGFCALLLEATRKTGQAPLGPSCPTPLGHIAKAERVLFVRNPLSTIITLNWWICASLGLLITLRIKLYGLEIFTGWKIIHCIHSLSLQPPCCQLYFSLHSNEYSGLILSMILHSRTTYK